MAGILIFLLHLLAVPPPKKKGKKSLVPFLGVRLKVGKMDVMSNYKQ